MIKLVTGMFSGLVLSQLAFAEEPAVYQEGVLTIPGAAVVNEDGSVQYYRNIQFQDDGGGNFHIIALEAGALATVDAVSVVTSGEGDTEEVEVVVEGTKSGCVDIVDPAITFENGEFMAVLPESEPLSDTCTEPEEQFEHSFPLDVTEAGGTAYTVTVNEVQASPDDGTPGATPGTDTGTGGTGTGTGTDTGTGGTGTGTGTDTGTGGTSTGTGTDTGTGGTGTGTGTDTGTGGTGTGETGTTGTGTTTGTTTGV